jgi:hypothetical protein
MLHRLADLFVEHGSPDYLCSDNGAKLSHGRWPTLSGQVKWNYLRGVALGFD